MFQLFFELLVGTTCIILQRVDHFLGKSHEFLVFFSVSTKKRGFSAAWKCFYAPGKRLNRQDVRSLRETKSCAC